VPIVASNRGSIPEVCGPAGLLCEAHDAIAFAGNLAKAAFDDSVRATLLAASTAQLATFSWQRCATELVALYRRLADASPA
jgi:glycosyltransferase involved in cell wall biosynthesis